MKTDLSYLKSMSDDDSGFIEEMVDIFREQIKEYSTELPRLLESAEYETLSKLAHKAKSSVAVMGMAEDADRLKDLEIKAKEGIEIGSYKGIIDSFIKNAAEAVKELDDQIKKN